MRQDAAIWTNVRRKIRLVRALALTFGATCAARTVGIVYAMASFDAKKIRSQGPVSTGSSVSIVSMCPRRYYAKNFSRSVCCRKHRRTDSALREWHTLTTICPLDLPWLMGRCQSHIVWRRGISSSRAGATRVAGCTEQWVSLCSMHQSNASELLQFLSHTDTWKLSCPILACVLAGQVVLCTYSGQ